MLRLCKVGGPTGQPLQVCSVIWVCPMNTFEASLLAGWLAACTASLCASVLFAFWIFNQFMQLLSVNLLCCFTPYTCTAYTRQRHALADTFGPRLGTFATACIPLACVIRARLPWQIPGCAQWDMRVGARTAGVRN